VSGIRNVIVIIMLIYAVSFILQLPACITIHNQCASIMLMAPVYFCNGAMNPKLFDHQIDIGTEASISFEIDTIRNKFESALLFKLEKHVKSDGQQNMNTSTTEVDKNETMHTHMLVICEANDAKCFAYVALVEDIKAFAWDEDKLKELHNKNCGWLKKHNDIVSDIWLFELNISISEEGRNDYATRPLYVDPRR
jgi:hypothetical protein